jgi:FkbM family methyltransferase
MKRKIQSVKRRLNQGFQAVFQPSKLYIYPRFEYSNHNLSFSQEGEDMILRRLFDQKKTGFYVDVGAHHPQKFSNTYFFYLKGWNGINIDPIPGRIELFNKLRHRDINLEIGISGSRQNLTYYIFNEQALNTFSKEIAYQRPAPYKIIQEKQVETYPLVEVLDQYLPSNQKIDFLNVDVEGLDEEVLKSNNWEKYRPHIILAESLRMSSLEEAMNSEVALFLQQKGYNLIAKASNTLLFEEKK